MSLCRLGDSGSWDRLHKVTGSNSNQRDCRGQLCGNILAMKTSLKFSWCCWTLLPGKLNEHFQAHLHGNAENGVLHSFSFSDPCWRVNLSGSLDKSKVPGLDDHFFLWIKSIHSLSTSPLIDPVQYCTCQCIRVKSQFPDFYQKLSRLWKKQNDTFWIILASIQHYSTCTSYNDTSDSVAEDAKWGKN